MGNEYCIRPTKVTIDSPWHHKSAVEKIARHFKREFGYDFIQFNAKRNKGHKKTCSL